ncbi:hypothetical protein ABIB34_000632 [Rhodococcus sp. UYP5]
MSDTANYDMYTLELGPVDTLGELHELEGLLLIR